MVGSVARWSGGFRSFAADKETENSSKRKNDGKQCGEVLVKLKIVHSLVDVHHPLTTALLQNRPYVNNLVAE